MRYIKEAAGICLAGMTLWCGATHAQTNYVCRSSSGTTYNSTRPCPPVVKVYGAPQSATDYERPTPSIGEAPTHLQYLSPRCASLNDAIRTGPARGLTSQTLSDMRKNYSRECSESERDASARMSEQRRDQDRQRTDAASQSKAERDRASLREQQCGESKRILVTKKARTDLTEGEKAELRRFEENYRSRCG